MINRFRVVNLLEGASYLLLLFIAMPLKYYWDYPMAVSIAGWIHGLLFIGYYLTAMQCAQHYQWSDRFLYQVFIAGLIPFACFFIDRKLARRHVY